MALEKPDLPDVPFEARLSYWLQFIQEDHRDEMMFLLRDAKLGGRVHQADGKFKGWNNVIKHQAGEALAMRMLCRALKLPEEEAKRLETLAFVHDARKHLDVDERRRTGDFTADEKEKFSGRFDAIRADADPDGNLLTATNEKFFFKIFQEGDPDPLPENVLESRLKNLSRGELLQYYIDSIFLGNTVMSPLKRIEKTEEKSTLNDESERTTLLGRKYWDAERQAALVIQRMIWGWLRKEGPPEELPEFLKKEMNREMVEHWLSAHASSDAEISRDMPEGESPFHVEMVSDTQRAKKEQNEDQAVLREENGTVLAGVFDGATSADDLHVQGRRLGKVAAIVAKATLKSLPMDTQPEQALYAINRNLQAVKHALQLPEHAGLITTGLVIRLQKDGTLDYAGIGDSHLGIEESGMLSIPTVDRMEPFERQEIAAGVAEAKIHGIPVTTILGAVPEKESSTWKVIHGMRTKENAPDGGGYGTLNGSPEKDMALYVDKGTLRLAKSSRVMLFTDGLALPVSVSADDRKVFLQESLLSGGLDAVKNRQRALEEKDPNGEQYPRLKKHDDATGILVERV